MKDFIITSLQPWDSTFGGNAKDIAYELSRRHRVLYASPSCQGKGIRLLEIRERLWVLEYSISLLPVNKLPDGILFDTANRYNNRKIFQLVNQCAARLGFHDIIHFCDNDVYRSFYAREFLQASVYLYYRRDNLHPVSYWSRHIGRLEPLLIKKSDIVLCNSSELARYACAYKAASLVHDIGQGVDLSAYRPDLPHPVPPEYRHLPRPYIGYTGALTSNRLDVELLYRLATARPRYTFILIGQRDSVFLGHPLCALPNVYFPGLKPLEQMPACIQAMDVCLNPQLINEITIGNYPRKIDEYLAMGKPVVATRTRTMELFKGYVRLCSSPREYLAAIDEALADNSPQKQEQRIAFAHTHSWAHSVEKIYKSIEQYENTNPL